MSKILSIAGVVFAVTLAVVIGVRLSADAMAVVVGIVCGVLASIPTTAILVWVLRQRDKQFEAQWQRNGLGSYPPVVVVNGQGQNGTNDYHPTPSLLAGTTPPGGRSFKVIGQENTETTGDVLPPFWEDL